MNNFIDAADEYVYVYHKYKTKKMSWSAFKKICGKKKNGWISGQMLCERHKIIITDFRTRRENYIYYFDLITKRILKFIRGSGGKKKVDYEKMFFGTTKKTKRKKLRIKSEKPYDFDKVNTNLLGVKKKIW